MATVPQWLMVIFSTMTAGPELKEKITPANTSCTMRRKGITVMAAVVVLTIQDIISAIISAEKVMIHRVMAKSRVKDPVTILSSGNLMP